MLATSARTVPCIAFAFGVVGLEHQRVAVLLDRDACAEALRQANRADP